MDLRGFLTGFVVGTAILILGPVSYLRLGLVDIRSDGSDVSSSGWPPIHRHTRFRPSGSSKSLEPHPAE